MCWCAPEASRSLTAKIFWIFCRKSASEMNWKPMSSAVASSLRFVSSSMPNETRNGTHNVIHGRGGKLEVILVAASAARRSELCDALASRFEVTAEFSSLTSLLEDTRIACGVIVFDLPDRKSREVQNREL